MDARLERFGDLRARVRNYPSFNVVGGSFDVDFVIRGPDLKGLYRYGEELRRRGLEPGGFRGLDTSLRLIKPELHMNTLREQGLPRAQAIVQANPDRVHPGVDDASRLVGFFAEFRSRVPILFPKPARALKARRERGCSRCKTW